jgi:hypothetical protein
LLSLEESAKRLAQTCLQRLQTLELDEVQPGVKTLRTLNADTWSFLIGSVSKLALKLVKDEWAKMSEFAIEINDDLPDSCECELLQRYGLPCKHHLLLGYQTGQPLPRLLLHPRWWLDGPPITVSNWQPSYGEQRQVVVSPKAKENDIAGAALQLIEARDDLGPEAQSRLDNTFIQTANTMLKAAQRNDTLDRLPIGTPDAVPKKTWRKNKRHGRADAAGLTSAVIAQKDLASKEKAEAIRVEKAAKAAALTAAKGKAAMVESRDEPAPERVDLESSEEDVGLPPSTAPSRLEDANTKRRRGKTLDYLALHTGKASKKTRPEKGPE